MLKGTFSSVGGLSANLSGVGGLSANLSTAFLNTNGEVKQYSTIHDLPNRGSSSTVYFVTSEDACYRWDDDFSKYFCVGRDYNEIEVIICGGSA